MNYIKLDNKENPTEIKIKLKCPNCGSKIIYKIKNINYALIKSNIHNIECINCGERYKLNILDE